MGFVHEYHPQGKRCGMHRTDENRNHGSAMVLGECVVLICHRTNCANGNLENTSVIRFLALDILVSISISIEISDRISSHRCQPSIAREELANALWAAVLKQHLIVRWDFACCRFQYHPIQLNSFYWNSVKGHCCIFAIFRELYLHLSEIERYGNFHFWVASNLLMSKRILITLRLFFKVNSPETLLWDLIYISYFEATIHSKQILKCSDFLPPRCKLSAWKNNLENKLTLHKLGDTAVFLDVEHFFFFALVLRLLHRDVEETGLLQFPYRSGPLKSQWTFFNSWTLSEKSYSGKCRTSS